MLTSIVAWSLRYRSLVLAAAAIVTILGAWRAVTMPRDVLPEIAPPYVEIQTEALGLSPAEVEQLITVPLEADLLHGVPFLRQIHSESVAGLSSVTLTFEPGTDLYVARQVVAERLTQAHALPQVSKPPAMLQPLSSANRVLMVGMASERLSALELSVLARWTIRPRLLSVPGVANVAIWGERDRQLQVLVDPERLHAQGVSLQQIIETTGNALWVSPLTFLDASTPGTGGFIDTPNQRLGIQHVLPIVTPQQLSDVVLVTDPGSSAQRTIRLADVATVVEGHRPVIGDAVVDEGPGLMMVVEKFPSADVVEVTRGVEAALAALEPGLAGVRIDEPVYRPATYLEAATGGVGAALAVGAALMALILVLLVGGWRPAVVGLATALAAGGGGLLAVSLLGATLTSFLVTGLVLAEVVVVFGAVRSYEGAARRLRDAPPDARSASAIVFDVAAEQHGPLLCVAVIAIAAGAPVLLIPGITGTIAAALIVPYLLAVAASLVVAVAVAPALSHLLLAGTTAPPRPSRAGAAVQAAALRATGALIRHGAAIAGLSACVALVATIVMGAVLSPRLATAPIPAFQEPQLMIALSGVPSTSRDEMAPRW